MSLNKLALLFALAAAVAHADGPTPSRDLPAAPTTLQEAEAQEQLAADLRREADRLRDEAQKIFVREDAACYDRFLVNACRDKVRQANIDRMRLIRQKEVDANQIDRLAKARKIELEASQRVAPQPTMRPLPQAGAPEADEPARSAPAAQVPADAQKRADAAREAAARRAESDRQKRQADAAKRRVDVERV
ncbi:MAG: hypothetical protein REI09_10310, partial [Candidatus Dactylopiibacterium sp.]|nr:hypothetical protein [Candidatus Dactylopiibacterium sp.]